MRRGNSYLGAFAAAFFCAFFLPGCAHASTVIYLTSGTSWTIPSDWNSSANTIEAIGGGGGGGSWGGGGGGGGEYRKISNFSATAGSNIPYVIGGGGAGDTDCSNGSPGGDTIFNTSSLIAKGGGAGNCALNDNGGAGGSGGTGALGYNGGAGGIGGAEGGGGGGAGGPLGAGGSGGSYAGSGGGGGGGNGGGGNGSNGAAGVAGAGGDNFGGTGGGAGGNPGTDGTDGGGGGGSSGTASAGAGGGGIEWDSSHGSGGAGGGGGTGGSIAGGAAGLYGGGGGGGAGAATSPGGDGAQGIIVITYTPAAATGRIIRLTGGMRLVGGVRLGGTSPVPSSACSQATAFLARISVDSTHQTAYTNLICGLVTDGLWSKFDILYIFATANSSAALTNLVSSTYSATANGAPSFSADHGYTTGDDQWLDTGLNLSTASQFTQDSAMFGAWNLTATPDFNSIVMAAEAFGGSNYLRPDDASCPSGCMAGEVNSSSVFDTGDGSVASGAGLVLGNRPDSTLFQFWQNSAQVGGDMIRGSAVPDNANLITAGENTNYANNGAFQIAAVFAGAGLTPTEISKFYGRMRAYMTAVGLP